MRQDDRLLDEFSGGIYNYIYDYYLSLYGTFYKTKVNYTIPKFDYIMEHMEEIHKEILTCESVKEYSKELQEIARDYIPIFQEECPWSIGDERLEL